MSSQDKEVDDNLFIWFMDKFNKHRISVHAAHVTFFMLVSFFPFMMLLVMIVSKLSVMNTNVLGYILRVVPSGLESYVAYIVDDVVNANVQSFTLITVFVSLWSAAKGIQTDDRNHIVDESDVGFAVCTEVSAEAEMDTG